MKFELDAFNGVIIDPASLPQTTEQLVIELHDLLAYLASEHKALAWVSLAITCAENIPHFIAAGFTFHSCLSDELTLVRQPPNPVFVPFVPTHTLGAGAIVLNEANEILLIKERRGSGFKLPGGHVEAAERIEDSVRREVLEETGIEAQFESIVSFATKHPYQFGKSNLHFICRMKALTHTINILDTDEIEEAKWVPLATYISDTSYSLSNRDMVNRVVFSQGLIATEVAGNSGPHKKAEVFMATPPIR